MKMGFTQNSLHTRNICDFQLLCSKRLQQFATTVIPPPINLPASVMPNSSLIKSFSQIQ
jgi:hypothetical protein